MGNLSLCKYFGNKDFSENGTKCFSKFIKLSLFPFLWFIVTKLSSSFFAVYLKTNGQTGITLSYQAVFNFLYFFFTAIMEKTGQIMT